jgi:hypothetical protein
MEINHKLLSNFSPYKILENIKFNDEVKEDEEDNDDNEDNEVDINKLLYKVDPIDLNTFDSSNLEFNFSYAKKIFKRKVSPGQISSVGSISYNGKPIIFETDYIPIYCNPLQGARYDNFDKLSFLLNPKHEGCQKVINAIRQINGFFKQTLESDPEIPKINQFIDCITKPFLNQCKSKEEEESYFDNKFSKVKGAVLRSYDTDQDNMCSTVEFEFESGATPISMNIINKRGNINSLSEVTEFFSKGSKIKLFLFFGSVMRYSGPNDKPHHVLPIKILKMKVFVKDKSKECPKFETQKKINTKNMSLEELINVVDFIDQGVDNGDKKYNNDKNGKASKTNNFDLDVMDDEEYEYDSDEDEDVELEYDDE